MTGVYEIRPAQWWDWPFHGIVAEQASIPAVTTLPESDDQQAVTVRFSYPSPAMFRGSVVGEGHPYANGGWMRPMEPVDRTARALPLSTDWVCTYWRPQQ